MFGMTPFEKRAYDVFDLFRDFDREFPSFSGNASCGFRTDIRDCGDRFVLEAELPGFEKNEINVDLDDTCLTISASHTQQTQTKPEDAKTAGYLHRERYCGAFTRKFGITGIASEQISAAYKNGVLTLELPKKQPEKPVARRLEIQEA